VGNDRERGRVETLEGMERRVSRKVGGTKAEVGTWEVEARRDVRGL
jgi:hypothetical protein